MQEDFGAIVNNRATPEWFQKALNKVDAWLKIDDDAPKKFSAKLKGNLMAQQGDIYGRSAAMVGPVKLLAMDVMMVPG